MENYSIELFKSDLKEYQSLIPEERLRLLYFSKEKPVNVGPQIGISLSLNVSFDGKESLKELINEELEKHKEENLQKDDLFNIIKKRVKVNVSFNKNSASEPSVIYTKLEIKRFDNYKELPRPGYYPAYASLTGEQRLVYLNWLTDITKPIAKGYVFIYYYGLERQLLSTNYLSAAKEMIVLINHHDLNKSICLMAIFYAFLKHSDDKLLSIIIEEKQKLPIDELVLLLKYNAKKPLSSKDIFEVLSQIPSINKRYIKNEPIEYLSNLDNYLIEKYGEPFYPFYNEIDIKDLPLEEKFVFYNYSLPEEIKRMEVFNFFSSTVFISKMNNIHSIVHESVKENLKLKRKLKK